MGIEYCLGFGHDRDSPGYINLRFQKIGKKTKTTFCWSPNSIYFTSGDDLYVSVSVVTFTQYGFRNDPALDISIVPEGMNYGKAENFPDKVSLYFGKEIKVQYFFDKSDLTGSANRIKLEVFCQLKKLTTHIEEEKNYENIVGNLDASMVDFLDPEAVNLLVNMETISLPMSNTIRKNILIKEICSWIFIFLNFPIVVIWKRFFKPKVREIEFLSTFRFMFGLLFYPLLYLVMITVLLYFHTLPMALMIFAIHLFLNMILVKLWNGF